MSQHLQGSCAVPCFYSQKHAHCAPIITQSGAGVLGLLNWVCLPPGGLGGEGGVCCMGVVGWVDVVRWVGAVGMGGYGWRGGHHQRGGCGHIINS